MNIQELIIQKYPLVYNVECELNCYFLEKRRYLVFWDQLVYKETILEVLKSLEEKTNNSKFTEYKTLIVLGKTKEKFKKDELFYFNNTNTFVVFYLINEKTGKVYMNDSWIFALGLNYRKYIRRINAILKNSNNGEG